MYDSGILQLTIMNKKCGSIKKYLFCSVSLFCVDFLLQTIKRLTNRFSCCQNELFIAFRSSFKISPIILQKNVVCSAREITVCCALHNKPPFLDGSLAELYTLQWTVHIVLRTITDCWEWIKHHVIPVVLLLYLVFYRVQVQFIRTVCCALHNKRLCVNVPWLNLVFWNNVKGMSWSKLDPSLPWSHALDSSLY
jgi:hypothetical protein